MKRFIIIFWIFSFFCTGYTQSLKYLRTIGKSANLNSPEGISVNSDGFIYIADTGNNRIVKFKANDVVIAEQGGLGWGKYQFDSPVDIWAKANLDVFIADKNNRRIVRYDKNLNYISSYPSSEIYGNPDIGYPVSTVMSLHGDLYILDAQNKYIIKLQTMSNSYHIFGDISNTFLPLKNPVKMEADRKNKIYVSDSERGSIFIYDLYGNLLQTVGNFTDLKGFSISNSGELYIIDGYSLRILHGSQTISEINLKLLKRNIKNPFDLDILNKNVYILDKEDNSVHIFFIER